MFIDFERERETLMWKRDINQLPPICAPNGNQTHSPGMCPDEELNPQPFDERKDAPTNWSTQPGFGMHFKWRQIKSKYLLEWVTFNIVFKKRMVPLPVLLKLGYPTWQIGAFLEAEGEPFPDTTPDWCSGRRPLTGAREGTGKEWDMVLCAKKPYFLLFFKFLLNLLGWHGLIQLYRFQHSTSSVYCIVCSPPQVKSPSTALHPPLPSSTSLPHLLVSVVITILSSVSVSLFFLFLTPSPFSLSSPRSFPSDSCRSVLCIYESVSVLVAGLFCSLDPTYKWNYTVLIFLWLAYFT